jgi:hypothetical protein
VRIFPGFRNQLIGDYELNVRVRGSRQARRDAAVARDFSQVGPGQGGWTQMTGAMRRNPSARRRKAPAQRARRPRTPSARRSRVACLHGGGRRLGPGARDRREFNRRGRGRPNHLALTWISNYRSTIVVVGLRDRMRPERGCL